MNTIRHTAKAIVLLQLGTDAINLTATDADQSAALDATLALSQLDVGGPFGGCDTDCQFGMLKAELEDKFSAVEAEYEAQETKITELEAALDAKDAEQDANVADLKAELNAKITEHRLSIANNERTLGVHADDIADNADTKDDHVVDIKALQDQVSALLATVAGLEDQINQDVDTHAAMPAPTVFEYNVRPETATVSVQRPFKTNQGWYQTDGILKPSEHANDKWYSWGGNNNSHWVEIGFKNEELTVEYIGFKNADWNSDRDPDTVDMQAWEGGKWKAIGTSIDLVFKGRWEEHRVQIPKTKTKKFRFVFHNPDKRDIAMGQIMFYGMH